MVKQRFQLMTSSGSECFLRFEVANSYSAQVEVGGSTGLRIALANNREESRSTSDAYRQSFPFSVAKPVSSRW